MGTFIQQSIRDGSLVLWHHYKRHAKDLSGNGNDGAHTNTRFTGNGIQFGNTDGKVTVDDNINQRGLQGTISIEADITSQLANERIMSKRDVGGQMWTLFLTATGVALYDGINTSGITQDVSGFKNLTCVYGHNEKPKFWGDANYLGEGGVANSIIANDAHIVIGNYEFNVINFRSVMRDALLFNSQLTSTGVSRLFGELEYLKHGFDSRPYEIVDHGTADEKWLQAKGIYESVAPVTAGLLENSGFEVVSGSHKIVHEVIDGYLTPVIECVSAGTVFISTGLMQQTYGESAYGTFCFRCEKKDASDFDIMYHATQPKISTDPSNSGYMLRFSSVEGAAIYRITNGSVAKTIMAAGAGTVPIDQFFRVDINNESPTGVISLYLDGVLMPTSVGSNPRTDNVHKESKYFVATMSVPGDKIALISKAIS